MKIEPIASYLKKKPFREFTVTTSDGETFTITHPETIRLMPEDDLVVVFPAGGGIHLLDTAQITRTGFVPRRAAKT